MKTLQHKELDNTNYCSTRKLYVERFFYIPNPFVYLLESLDKDGGSSCAINIA